MNNIDIRSRRKCYWMPIVMAPVFSFSLTGAAIYLA
jgi:hypothetical protein